MAYMFKAGLGTTMGPVQDPNAPVPPSGSQDQSFQNQIDALFAYTGAGQQPSESIAPVAQAQPATTMMSWFSAHSEVTTVAIILAALLLFGGRRR